MKRRKLLTFIGGVALSIGLVGLLGVGPLPAQSQNQASPSGCSAIWDTSRVKSLGWRTSWPT